MARTAPALVGLLLAALLAGCTGGSGGGGGPDEQSLPWPLTGLPGYPEGSTAQVVVVKVDDTEGGSPQVGLADADLVVQEMVEGGATRLAAIYLSTYPTRVEPVRSVRRTDIGIVLPTGGTVAASGGESATLAAVQSAGIPIAVEGDPGFSRDPGRAAPYNLQLDVSELAATLPVGPPPGPYLQFGPVPADAVGEPVAGLALTWPIGGSQFEWDAGSGTWVRSDPAAPEGLAFTTVIALTLDVEYLGGNDASGTPIPTMVTEGSGTGVVATGGRAYEVEWSKAAPGDPWRFTHAPTQGATPVALPVPAGRTWLGLLPRDGGSVTLEQGPEPSGSGAASGAAP